MLRREHIDIVREHDHFDHERHFRTLPSFAMAAALDSVDAHILVVAAFKLRCLPLKFDAHCSPVVVVCDANKHVLRRKLLAY